MSLFSRLKQKHQARSSEATTLPLPPQKKFFVHIPKTAGTSFRQSAVDCFGQKKILQDYGSKRAATSSSVKSCVYLPDDVTGVTDAFANSGAVMISGHVQIAKYAGIIGLPNTISFIREPVSRVVSHYRHMLRDEGFDGDLLMFANQPKYRNTQTRVLCQLDPALIGIIGITEQYQESIDIINRRWNWTLNQRKDNISDKLSGLKVSLSSEETAEITNLNLKDLALYDRAILVFGNSLACLKSGSNSDPRGKISAASANHGISGWAFDMFSDQAAEIDVVVNKEVRANLKCTDFRPILAGWKVPRSGYIGYHFRSETLKDGDEIEIRDSKNHLLLDSTRA